LLDGLKKLVWLCDSEDEFNRLLDKKTRGGRKMSSGRVEKLYRELKAEGRERIRAE
jgi:hypothetical protein